ncbi:MAG: ABC transporter ATP-binding protein [Clostridiales bacterium]|nr:ABC transporter ATP-binding protein [Clostridiales bacterium]
MLTVKNLNKIYGTGEISVHALRDVNFTIIEGEYVSIIGPSGSGKSTLMNILGCLDQSSSGEYILDQQSTQSLTGKELATVRNKKIGFVFQSYNLLPKLSALKNVELSMIYSGVPNEERKKRAKEALIKVGLEDRMNHKPPELSGGQKQRVAIARAIVNNPSIILADEPTGNLDSVSTGEILKLFDSLNEEGKTIILVTHETDVADKTKRMLSFSDGYLIKDEVMNR